MTNPEVLEHILFQSNFTFADSRKWCGRSLECCGVPLHILQQQQRYQQASKFYCWRACDTFNLPFASICQLLLFVDASFDVRGKVRHLIAVD